MKKIVIVNGLIAGVIVSAMFFITMGLYHKNGNYEGGMLIGYASMLLAFSLIFVAIKNYRDKYNAGIISFGKGFKIGLYITLIASTIYVIGWLIDYYCFIPDFAEKYAASMLDKLKAGGAAATEIAAKTKEMDSFITMYKNPVYVILFTYVEILPVGLLVALIAALILKRKAKAVV
jgi:Protein of unknown function (DUF4199)